MGLFDWFKNSFSNGKNNSQSADTLQQEKAQTMNTSRETDDRLSSNAPANLARNHAERQVPREIFISEDSAAISGFRKVYSFVERDFEQQGYDDAFSISDIGCLEKNIEHLKQEFINVLRKEILIYEADLLDIKAHIDIRKNAGFIDLVYELTTRFEIIKGFKEHLEDQLKNIDTPGSLFSVVAHSYKKGFMRALTDITKVKFLNKPAE